MEGIGELWAMLKLGSIDFVGQKQTFDMQYYVICIAGIIGFIYGLIMQRFLYTFYCIFGARVLVTAVCLPAWPCWNRHPVKWREPKEKPVKLREPKEKPEASHDTDEDDVDKKKKKNSSTKKSNKQKE